MSTFLLLAQQTAIQPNLLLWALLAIGVALVLFALELFIPSSMILGTSAIVSLIVGIVLLFRVDSTYGLMGIVASLVAVPVGFGFAIRIWPHTPVARLLSLREEQKPVTLTPEAALAGPTLGAVGRAVADLRPVGVCVIDGKRVECLAESSVIRSGATVRVVAVDGMHIKVREEA